ncbi:hypothetical protein [Longispora fulva]|uniref:Uncharacterized protein n=1 Tax=Longispora fulva TaxID=619741 RepID=A0A8J7GFK2_9ACTN|nr:hypothetical protein [Longispora fulva]MBG6136535.1 hypothetical protein [Longispora fulva]
MPRIIEVNLDTPVPKLIHNRIGKLTKYVDPIEHRADLTIGDLGTPQLDRADSTVIEVNEHISSQILIANPKSR